MIPVHLRIAGFLSYRDPVELDFTSFDLACISGSNGAGKSSLLDSITWALFGQARKRDEAVINLQSAAADVAFTFSYEDHLYRILRRLPRGKNMLLEFQLKNGEDWKVLTERTSRETQARIEQTLRLDYETFTNAAFFLQGKADQFTQQTAGRRKEVLSSILGLEIWETYRERTADQRKDLENLVGQIDGRIAEIDAELAEAEQRKTHLGELEAELKRLAAARRGQEAALENIQKSAASLEQQARLVETLATAVERQKESVAGLQARLADREAESGLYADLITRARDIEAAFRAWQKRREELDNWDTVAGQFLEHEKKRAPLAEQVAAEKARLEEEQRRLMMEQDQIQNLQETIEGLRLEIAEAQKLLGTAEARLARRGELETQAGTAREGLAAVVAENAALKIEMDELKGRIDRLKAAGGAACPLCGQELTPEHRKTTLKQLEQEGKQRGDRYRANKAGTDELTARIQALEAELEDLGGAEDERVARSNAVTQLTERMESLKAMAKEWETGGKKRLKEVTKLVESGKFAPEARKELDRLDKELAKLGYDRASHEAVRQAEAEERLAEEEHTSLGKARAALKPIDDEIANLKTEIAKRSREIDAQAAEYERARASLEAAHAQAPDLNAAERILYDLQEQENRLNQEVGAARQKVDVLDVQRGKKSEHASRREELQKEIARHRTLERAFGKDGVPALLIEQALPEIESRANEMLDRLTNSQMSIRFATQSEYKDKKRGDLRETLDIKISDAAGLRDYEMYSGGEAFRVNFAIRLALSEVLAQRKGARLQTLVIDEGFGSQDIQGRQRLIEAINTIRGDFAKILVITHLEELKDAFPTRIEVEKGDGGSTVKVI